MHKVLRLLITLTILLVLTGAISRVEAQNPPQPDCFIPINLVAAGSTGNFDNRFIGCDTWTLTYASSGFTGLSITLQSANGATVATIGAFGTYTGTVVTGINPNTNTTGRISQFQNGLVITPWLRVNLAGLTGTGTVSGVVYGYKTGYSSGNGGGGGSTCPGTVATPCVVDGPDAAGAAPTQNPVQISLFDATNVRRALSDTSGRLINDPLGAATAQADAASNSPNVPFVNGAAAVFPGQPSLFNGATWDRQLTCPSTVVIDDSTMGLVTVIAASGSTKIRICKMTFTTAAGVNVQLFYGTGAACVTTSTALSLLYQNASTIAEDFIADQSALTTPASQAVCLSLSAGTRTTGMISYTQF
jgi:hypothetical protein